MHVFMSQQTNFLVSEYARIKQRTIEDPATAGDQGEENWAEILRNWLPSDYKIVTKGRLINDKGDTSPQLDILVLKPYYPNYLINKKLYFLEGVFAVFECKNSLKSEHLTKSAVTAKEIRSMYKPVPVDLLEYIFHPIIFGVLCHTHSWKKAKSKPILNINNALKNVESLIEHPFEYIDILGVNDLPSWFSFKLPFTFNYDKSSKNHSLIPQPLTGYGIQHLDALPFSPLGSSLSRICKFLPIHDSRLKSVSKYFTATLSDNYTTITNRHWPGIFPNSIIPKVYTHYIDSQKQWIDFI